MTKYGWPICNAAGCREKASSGGCHYRETGYWSLCMEHGILGEKAGKPQPKMKRSAIAKERSRDENGYLPSKS